MTGRSVTVKRGERRPGDPPALVADSRRITKELGWSPSTPELSTIIDSAWRWMSEHPEGYAQ